MEAKRRRAVIVAGLRTPFAKRQTTLRDFDAVDLGRLVVSELLERIDLPPEEVDQLVFGQVIPSLQTANAARDIVLGTGLPLTIPAYTVAMACITSYRTTADVVQSIEAGNIDCGIAGGAESASNVPIGVTLPLQDAINRASKAANASERVRAFAGVKLGDLVPQPPALEEPTTGESMGEAAERMVKINGISREAQDEFAHMSHVKAARGWEDGFFADQVMPVHVPPMYEETLERDNLVRFDSDLEGYKRLKPVFDRAHGTITAANASPLTDGASALLIMEEEKARSLGLPILGRIRSHAFTAVDPADQLLIGPVYATPVALDRAGVALGDMDLIDMHEAFAGQMLAVLQSFASDRFARDELGRDRALGEIDEDRLNIHGGSISIGHPFAATGARQIMHTLKALKERGGELALCTACAAGGLGAAMILEAV
jgi:acetyl-CoA acyltransferase